MKSKINYLISLLLGLLIIMSVAGIPVEVFNHPKTFAVFGMAGISLIISFLCFIAPQKDIKFSRLNIFCFLFLFTSEYYIEHRIFMFIVFIYC